MAWVDVAKPQASVVASAPIARKRVKRVVMAQLPFERPRAKQTRSHEAV